MSHLIDADEIKVDTTSFTGNLSITDVNVQAALDTIDDLIPSPWTEGAGITSLVTQTDQVIIGPTAAAPFPVPKLYVIGDGSTSGTSALRVDNSSRDDIFELRDDGTLAIAADGASNIHESNAVLTLSAPTTNILCMRADTANSLRFEDATTSSLKGYITLNNTTGDMSVVASAQNTGEISLSVGNPVRSAFHVGYDYNSFFGADTTVTSGSGSGVIAIKDASVAPTTDPVGGALLYSTSGELITRTSAGEIINIPDLRVDPDQVGSTSITSRTPASLTWADVSDSSIIYTCSTDDVIIYTIAMNVSCDILRKISIQITDGATSGAIIRVAPDQSITTGDDVAVTLIAYYTGLSGSTTFRTQWGVDSLTGSPTIYSQHRMARLFVLKGR